MMGYTLRIYGWLIPDPLPANAGEYYERLGARPGYQATRKADGRE